MPLPFEWLEVWCKVVGVPFADYLVVYWASEKAYFEAQEREAQAKEAEQQAPCISSTETPAPELSSVTRALGCLSPLRAAFDRIARCLRSLFPTA